MPAWHSRWGCPEWRSGAGEAWTETRLSETPVCFLLTPSHPPTCVAWGGRRELVLASSGMPFVLAGFPFSCLPGSGDVTFLLFLSVYFSHYSQRGLLYGLFSGVW